MDSGLKLSHSSLSTSHGSSFSISQSSFKVTKRGLQGALGSSLAVGVILFSSEFISKASSINHSLLGLLLRVLSSLEHGINLSLESVDLSLKTSFGSHVSGVDGLHLIASRSGVRDLHVKLALSSLSRVKEGTALLNLTREGSSLALSNTSLLIDLLALAGLILKGLDGLSQLSLVSLDGLESLSIGLVGMVKSNFKLIDISLKFLLDAECFSLGSLFSFKGSSKRFHGTLVVLASVVELFLLLSNSSVNFLADLAKLKLSSQDLVLLLLKSSLSLLKSTLELFLLLLKSSALLVKVMDGASTISKLVKEILDFISKVLVLPLDNVKLFKSLILSSLQAVQLRAVVAAFILGSLNFSSNISSLSLPFSKDLVKVLASLLSDKSSSMNTLILHGDLIQVRGKSGLGLLNVGNLGLERINILLSLNNSGLELGSSSLKLFNSGHTLSFISGLPELNLSLSLGKSLKSIRLAHMLILSLFLQVLKLCGHVLILGEESSSVLSLSIGKSLGVLKLGGERNLVLVGSGNSILTLLNLSVEVLVLTLQTLLGRLSLIESSGHLIKSGVSINNGALEQFSLLVKLSLALDSILKGASGISKVTLKTSLILLGLDLVSIEVVNLLSKFSHGVVVLLSKSSQSTLMGNVQLLKFSLESGKLLLSLLVELNLSGSVGASLLKTRGDILNVLLQEGAGLLSLGTVSSLNGKLLIKFLKSGLE